MVALCVGDAVVAQELQRVAVFNAFCERLFLQSAGARDECVDHELVGAIGRSTGDELAVDLDEVDLEEQWGNFATSSASWHWNWFACQFTNRSELMLYRFSTPAGRPTGVQSGAPPTAAARRSS